MATFVVSLISIVGIISLLLKEKLLNKILIYLISFSAGAMLGTAFLHFIPEALESLIPTKVFIYVLLGFIVFFITEKFIHWRHCHLNKCSVHTFAYMNLFGDAAHNFIDGLIIAGAFVIDLRLGLVTTLAIAFHEIPQEIGDFGVLVYAGFSKYKALFYNFLTALTAILGGLIGFYLSNFSELFLLYLLPFAAGGFIYIGASDLVPEVKKEPRLMISVLSMVVFITGLLLVYFL